MNNKIRKEFKYEPKSIPTEKASNKYPFDGKLYSDIVIYPVSDKESGIEFLNKALNMYKTTAVTGFVFNRIPSDILEDFDEDETEYENEIEKTPFNNLITKEEFYDQVQNICEQLYEAYEAGEIDDGEDDDKDSDEDYEEYIQAYNYGPVEMEWYVAIIKIDVSITNHLLNTANGKNIRKKLKRLAAVPVYMVRAIGSINLEKYGYDTIIKLLIEQNVYFKLDHTAIYRTEYVDNIFNEVRPMMSYDYINIVLDGIYITIVREESDYEHLYNFAKKKSKMIDTNNKRGKNRRTLEASVGEYSTLYLYRKGFYK